MTLWWMAMPYACGEKAEQPDSVVISLNTTGHELLKAKQERRAADCFRKAAQLSSTAGDTYHEMQARHGLYQALWTLNPDSARLEMERFNRLKDSLYRKTSSETLAKYNAEFGNDQLQAENYLVSRSRIYIIIMCIALLAVAIVLVVRQRRLIALQKKRN